MYVAIKEINLGVEGRVPAGEPVPQALSWSYPVIVALLNGNYMKWVDTNGEENPIDKARNESAKMQLEYQKRLSTPVLKKLPKEIKTESMFKEPDITVNGYVAPKVTAPKTLVQKAAATVISNELTCPTCPGRTFTSQKNLKIHIAFHDKRK